VFKTQPEGPFREQRHRRIDRLDEQCIANWAVSSLFQSVEICKNTRLYPSSGLICQDYAIFDQIATQLRQNGQNEQFMDAFLAK